MQFILRRDQRGILRFAALQGRYGNDLRVRHPELQALDSMAWFEPEDNTALERLLLRSDAAIEVGRYLGGWWSALAWLGRGLPRSWRDPLYRFVARHRHRVPGMADTCALPTPETRARFLD